MEFLKKNFAILLAFTLPIGLIVVVALSTYLPSFFLSTNYNFVYTSCTDGSNYHYSDCGDYQLKRYSVVGTTLVMNTVVPTANSDTHKVPNTNNQQATRIFLHDTEKNESREITFEEAQKLSFNSLLTSPDSVTVSNHYDRGGSDFFIFGGGSSSYGYYLTKGRSRSKINLIDGANHYYSNDFQFIGWVVPGRN